MVGVPWLAVADVVSTADVAVNLDITSLTYTGTLTFDHVTYTPFGVSVNLGDSVVSLPISGTISLPVAGAGTFTETSSGGDPDLLAGETAGEFTCADPTCFTGVTLVGQFLSLSGTAVAGLPADARFSFDGSLGPLVLGGTVLSGTGRVALNAFRPVTTPASPDDCEQAGTCAVPVASTVDYVLPDGSAGTVNVDITFPNVVTEGETTVSAASAAVGDLPANVAVDLGGYHAAFFELQTTAEIDTDTAQIEVCLSYDLTDTGVEASQLRFLHREDGVFVDRTSRVDEAARVVCGSVLSFSPVVLGVTFECSTDANCADGNPCTDDTCSALGACRHQLPTGCSDATKASLKIKDSPDANRDTVTWKFKGPGVNFGQPDVSTSYALCAADGSNVIVLAASAPAGGTCVGKPCWNVKNGGAKYKRKGGSPDGLTSLRLKASKAGVASLTVKGKGPNLHVPAIPVSVPVTALLRRSDAAACWSATFSLPTRNVAGAFSAKQ